MTDEALTNSLCNVAMERTADWLVAVLCVAVKRHPEKVRSILGQVFDLAPWANQARTVKADIKDIWEEVAQVREVLFALKQDLQSRENDTDRINLGIDLALSKIDQLKEKVA